MSTRWHLEPEKQVELKGCCLEWWAVEAASESSEKTGREDSKWNSQVQTQSPMENAQTVNYNTGLKEWLIYMWTLEQNHSCSECVLF